MLDFEEVFKVPAISTDPAVSYLWPQTSITSSYPPTFLGHGSIDSIAPAKESEHFASVLTEKGVKHELLIVPGHEHIWDQAEGVAVVDEGRAKILAFLEKQIAA